MIVNDWIKLKSTVTAIKILFISNAKENACDYLISYLDKIENILDNLLNIVLEKHPNPTNFLKKIFINTTCDSGHQAAITGWGCILYGFLNNKRKPVLLDTLQNETHIFSVPYKHDDHDYVLHYGINSVEIKPFKYKEYEYNMLITKYNKTICKVDIKAKNIKPKYNKAYIHFTIKKAISIYEYLYSVAKNPDVNYPQIANAIHLSSDEMNKYDSVYKSDYNKIIKWWFKNFKSYLL